MKNLFNKQSLIVAIGFLILGLLLGGMFFGGNTDSVESISTEHNHDTDAHPKGEVWTCSMHPQIRQDDPGQCPICGMDLIPVTEAGPDIAPEGAVQMTSSAIQIANIQTVTVQRAEAKKEIYLNGRIVVDERRVSEITAHFNGRIEKLFVNFTGQEVKRGQVLASVYSPQLVTAQKELFEAARFKETNPSFFEAAINKLKLWDLTDRQIQSILESQEVRYNFNVLAPRSGTVVSRHVNAGDHIYEGQSMFEVAGLDQLWVVFDAYESNLPWIQEGDTIRFTVQSLPGRTFTSEVTFIDPVIMGERRVAEIRTEVENEQNQLKPEMFAQGVLESELSGEQEALIIPKAAILWTGKRAVVYVKQTGYDAPTFAYREVVLGPETGNFYVVKEGLTSGEEIVANGVFKIDAAAQLQGKVSMMNPNPSSAMGEHNYGGNSRQSPAITNPVITGVPAEFQKQLTALLEPYLKLKNALVDSDAVGAAEAAQQTEQVLAEVEMSLVSGEAHQQWMGNLKVIQKSLDEIQSSDALETQREAFAPLSESLYRSIQNFNVTGLDLYYQYCPMADRDQGAFWMSEVQEINNPYFGEAMLRCGETRETLE